MHFKMLCCLRIKLFSCKLRMVEIEITKICRLQKSKQNTTKIIIFIQPIKLSQPHIT